MPRLLRPSTFRARARGEEGAFLVEILVTITILALATAAGLEMVDTQTERSAVQRERSHAAELAQSRLEELRALPFDQLRTMPASSTQTKTVGGREYRLVSTVTQRPSTDASGECRTSRGRDVVQLSVQARWTRSTAKPIQVDTLVAAPVGAAGATRVLVTNADGAVLPGVTATAAGRSAMTDDTGCAVLFLPPGDHDVTVSRAGFVAPQAGAETQSVSVLPEKTVALTFELDQPGSVLTQFRYRRLGDTADRFDADPKKLIVSHANLPTPGYIRVPRVPTDAEPIPRRTDADRTFRVDDLYPHTSMYSLYAGACTGQKPATPQAVKVNRAATPATPTTIDLWALNVYVRSGTARPPADTKITVRSKCDASVSWTMTAATGLTDIPNVTTNLASSYRGAQQFAANGFPFGPTTSSGYTVCVEPPAGSTGLNKRWADVVTANGAYTQVHGTVVDLNMAIAQTSGVYPCT